MYKINFEKPVHVHFIGIGGISMSGLAEILLKEGFTISGSDNKESALTDHLEKLGAKVFYGQKASNIISGIDVVVYTAAIHPDNEEFAEAVKQNLPMLTRAELLGQLMTNYDVPIAISGTHGKTTTTSMLSHILLAGELDPTISVGGILKAIGGNIRVGNSEYFVTEACEYTNSFLHFFPKIGVILNIDEDHLDFFKDLADIRNSFHRFAKLLPKDGTLVINDNIPDLEEITADLDCRVIRYGNDSSLDYSATNVLHDKKGEASFDLVKSGEFIDRISLSVNGDHNVSNALAAIAIGLRYDVPMSAIKAQLSTFSGQRQNIIHVNDYILIDDAYNASPDSIKASLSILSEFKTRGRKIAVLSDMLELGPDSPEYHKEVGRFIATTKVTDLFITGELSRHYIEEAWKENPSLHTRAFSSNGELIAFLETYLKKNDVVLIKGSNGMNLKEVSKALMA